MLRTHMPTALFALLVLPMLVAAGDPKADELASAVMKASGADVWPRVKKLNFTFNAEQGGKTVMSARHEWDVAAGTDTVTWNGKTATIKLGDANDAGDAREAFKRWTNDTYWLLAPLKLKDGGVTVTHAGTQEVDGKQYDLLHLSFSGVGLTPGDQYNLYIDPASKQVRHWDYMPSPDKKVRATWEGYQDFNGLVLATERHIGDRRIFFTDVSVER